MTTRKIGLEIEGKVIVDADVTKARGKIADLNNDGVIGNRRPTSAAPAAGQGLTNDYFEKLAQQAFDRLSHAARGASPEARGMLGQSAERALTAAVQSGNRDLVQQITLLREDLRRAPGGTNAAAWAGQKAGFDKGFAGVPGAPAAPGSTYTGPQANAGYYEQLAERSFHAISSRYQQARTPTQFRDLLNGVERALYNANQSGNKDLVGKLGDLKNEIGDLEKTMQRARHEAKNPAPPQPDQQPNPLRDTLNNVSKWLGGQGGQAILGRSTGMLGGALGGVLGGGLARLATGPLGIAIGALSVGNYAFNAVANKVQEENALARNEVTGFADLARQYGTDRNLMTLFRDSSGWTNNRFARHGFTATEAAHVAAVYDRPGGMMNDTESILKFSRSTGVESARAAALAQMLGRPGVGGLMGGNADQGLRTMKLAMAEGIKAGIAGSEIMNSISGAVQRNYQRGMAQNDTSLAFFASMQGKLNASQSPVMRGEQGMNVMQGFMDGLANGGGDQGMMFLLQSTLVRNGLPGGAKAGMKGNEAKYYDSLAKESPLMAAEYLMQRASSGKNPQVMKMLAETIDKASGGSSALKTMMYKQLFPGASSEQIADVIGGGGIGTLFGQSANSAELERYKQGQGTGEDVQGGNALASQTMYLRVAESDREMIKSLASLKLTGGLEGKLSEIKNEVAGLRGDIATLLGGGGQGGSMAGTTDAAWVNPSNVPLPAAAGGAGGNAPVPSGGGTGAGPLSGFARTVSAVAHVETTNGANPNTYNPARSRIGLFQMKPDYLLNGWAKEAGVVMKNPDGSQVKTAAQAKAWMIANPGQSDKVALYRLGKIEEGVRAAFQRQGIMPNNEHVAGLVAAIWHENGGLNLSDFGRPVTDPRNPLRPFLNKGKLPTTANEIPEADAGDGINHRQQYLKGRNAYMSDTLKPANIGADAFPISSRVAPAGEAVTFTQGFGSNPDTDPTARNNSRYGYDERGHLGWDFRIGVAGRGGEEVRSRVGGVVVHAGKYGSYGNAVIVKLSNGYKVLHGHLEKVMAKVGQNVNTSTVIGTEGATGGPAGMAPHLHVEVWDPKGTAVDPSVIFGKQSMKVGKPVKGFARGGYTGNHATDEVAGVVHGQEFVMNAEATARHRALLERLNSGQSAGGTVHVHTGDVSVTAVISPGALAELHEEQRASAGRMHQIVSRDIQNTRGVRG